MPTRTKSVSSSAFAAASVNLAAPHTPYTPTELLRAVTDLATWSKRQGVELTTDAVFASDNIADHVTHGLTKFATGTRTNRRAQLLRVAEALLEPHLAPRRLPALVASDPTAPYTVDEVAELVEWARKETKERRADATLLLALGLGAGLSAQEVANIRAEDVTATDGAVLVRVREGRVRTVPVLRRWEKTITRRAAALEPTEYLFRPGRDGAGKNLISNFVARSSNAAVHAQTQRMRSTWLVTQMSACTPLPELVEAAGVDSLEALTRYLRFVERAPVDVSASRLRAA